jgi:predicted dehydrogenase
MHPTHVVDILQRYGKHIVVEKPPALNLADLDRMRLAAEQAGKKIFPIYQHRYNKAVRLVREALQTGRLGKAALATVRVRWCRPQSYYNRDPWRGTWSLDGGALTNQGIHYLDLLLHLMGEPEQVSASIATRLVQAEVEDTAVATIRFPGGALGIIEVTTAARPRDFEASLSVLAENGTAVLGGIACNELWTWTLDPDACAANSEAFPNVYGLGHTPLIRDVVAELLDGVPHPIPFSEGARAVRLLNAVYRSAEDGTPVLLQDRPASHRLGRPDSALEVRYLTQPE